MNNLLRSAFLVFLLYSFSSAQTLIRESNPVNRNWVGKFMINDSTFYMKLILDGKSSRLLLPRQKILWLPLSNLSLVQSAISFQVTDSVSGNKIEVKGEIKETILSGSAFFNGKKSTVTLYGYNPIDAQEASSICGLYELPDKKYLSIVPFSDGIEIVNYSTSKLTRCWRATGKDKEQRFMELLPLKINGGGEDKFQSVYIKNDSLVMGPANDHGLKNAKKVGLAETKMTLTNNSIKIGGSLFWKTNLKSMKPLIVILSGSGLNTRYECNKIINFFASIGFIVFSYDKRGVGESTGNCTTATFQELSSDVIAMVKELSKNPNVDAKNIFLWGHSQGGWLAPLSANNCDLIKGVITVSGPTDGAGAQTTYAIKNFLRTNGYSKKEIDEAEDWMNTITRVMDAKGEGYEKIEQLLPIIKQKRWSDFVTIPKSKADLLSWGGYYYNPIVELKKLKIPLLACFGGNDINVDGKGNAKTLRKLSHATKINQSTILFLPDGDHDMILGPTGDFDIDLPYQTGYSPKYLDEMKKWIENIINTAK